MQGLLRPPGSPAGCRWSLDTARPNSDNKNQVMAGGLEQDTDADSIVATIREFLAVDNRSAKVTNFSTLIDPTSFGVIEFVSVLAKYVLHKKIKDAVKYL